MAARSKHKQQPARPALAKGGVIALVVSALTAVGMTWPRLQILADVQSLEAATEIHQKQNTRVETGFKELRETLDSHNKAQTQRLDRILEVVLKHQR